MKLLRGKRRIFDNNDWEAADQIDRMYMHLMEPERWILGPRDQERLDNLRAVWSIMIKNRTNTHRAKMISRLLNVTERSVFYYMEEANALFGDVLKMDTELELHLAYDRYMKLYKKAMDDKDYDTARRCQDSAILTLQKIEERKPIQQRVYAKVTFTDSPDAIRNRAIAEDTEYEDLTNPNDERLLEPEAITIPADNQAV